MPPINLFESKTEQKMSNALASPALFRAKFYFLNMKATFSKNFAGKFFGLVSALPILGLIRAQKSLQLSAAQNAFSMMLALILAVGFGRSFAAEPTGYFMIGSQFGGAAVAQPADACTVFK